MSNQERHTPMNDIQMTIPEPESITELKNPFEKSCAQAIHIHVFGKGEWSASIEFKNGDTEGTQRFKDPDFNILVFKMNEFLKSIEK